ncbi:MAG: hypothetical protein ACRC62_38590 [Microcoleus sp.]
MKEKKLLLAYCLIGASFTGTIDSVAIATPAINQNYTHSQNNLAQAPELSKAVLTLQDLPSGFTQASSLEDNFKNRMSQQKGMKPETVFAFQKMDSQQFQLILGFTMQGPVELDRASFDTYFRNSDFAQKFVTSLNKGNQASFSNVTLQPLPDNVGKFSAGWTTRGTMGGIPMRLDAGIFGRGKLVSCLLTLYVEGNNSTVPLNDLARKLDDRLIDLMPSAAEPSQ